MINPGAAQSQLRDTSTVSVTVRLDGKDVTMDPGGLASLSVGLEVNRIPWARLVFSDGAVEKQSFDKSNADAFSPGKKVEILMGYSQQQETIFKGIITGHKVKIVSGGYYRLELECKDPVVKATVVKRSLYYYNKTDKVVIQQILKAYPGLQSGAMQDGIKHETLVQYEATDWDFMLLRADAAGLMLRVDDGKVDLIKPEVKSIADLQVQFGMGGSGISVDEFESEIDVRDHYPGVTGHSWDAAQQKLLDQKAGKTEGGGAAGALGSIAQAAGEGGVQKDFPDVLYSKDNTVDLYHGGELDSAALKTWVEAKQKRGELARTRGRVAITGTKALPGDTLEVGGISNRFNGKHLITGVLHQFVRGHWKTDIQFGWSRDFTADQLCAAPPDAGGLVPGIRGLHTGIVSKVTGNANMPDSVLVRIPYLAANANGTQSQGIWARLGTVYAGKGHSFVFRPEVNDEVVVGFINNDPNNAVVLGALHSSKNSSPNPLEPSANNERKGFVAKSGMQFIFDDDKQTILLSANGSTGPRLEIDGKNSKITLVLDGSNSLEMTSLGIKLIGTRIDLN